jgi:hypothetical protein
MTTQMQVPKELHSVGIVVQSGGSPVFCDSYPVADGEVTLPSTLGFTPRSENSGPVTVSVLGFKKAQPDFSFQCLLDIPQVREDGTSDVSVIRRRRSPYIPERVFFLPMPIKHACTNTPCGDGETCIGGECRTHDIDPNTLPEYRDSLILGNTNTCFRVDKCLPPSGSFPAALVDADECRFRLMVPDGLEAPTVGLNVRIMHENFTPEVLDQDTDEGFVLPEPTNLTEFKLATSLCNSRYKQGKILGVWGSTFCPPKTQFQPICDGDLEQIVSGTSSPFGDSTCVAGDRLRPTQSALYVLMDRSQSVAKFFGEEGLNEVLGLSLQDPVFERTFVGFKFMPASAGDCGAMPSSPNSFGVLTAPADVPFTLAIDARQAIASKIGDPSNVLPNDPALFLDAVMSPAGAYAALQNLGPATAFNRRAALILANRDLWTRCTGGQSPDQLAAQALAAGIHTYVVALRAPPSTDQGGRDPVADGAAIALSGGTELFDATSDPDVGARALATIVTDLGSCVYDQPVGVDLSQNQAATTLSYFDAFTQKKVVIQHNTSCSVASTTDSGWNLDSEGRVRVCGAACESLRNAVTASSALAARQSLPAPLIPIHANLPCTRGGS